MFSIVIPARDEAANLGACLDSIAAAAPTPGEVEVIVVINRCTDATEDIATQRGARIVHDDSKNLSRIRNAGASRARGEILVTIDADGTMTPNMLTEIGRALASGRYVGGGTAIRVERMSLGILLSGVFIGLYLARLGISAGLFWCYRRDFEAIGGFDEQFVSAEDVDFACRLKAHGRARGLRFGTIRRAHIRTSARKFDMFGDWVLFRRPGLARDLLRGRSREAADGFFYDVTRRGPT